MSKFYTFRQNNSGGSFDHEAAQGIGINVIIEAVDSDQANVRARSIGLYFNGCESGADCGCCGDRWYEASDYDSEDTPMIYGDKVRAKAEGEEAYLDWGLPSYLHPLLGSFVEVVKEES